MIQCLHELSPCVSSMFVCSSGDLVGHLFQGGRGGISRSEVVSCSHLFQYFCWNWFRINTGICRDAAFRMMVRKIFSPFWQFDGSRLLLSLSSISLRYRYGVDSMVHLRLPVGCCCLPSETYGRNGAIPIFRSSQNCQFHHRRLESLEHFNVLLYIILSTTVSF